MKPSFFFGFILGITLYFCGLMLAKQEKSTPPRYDTAMRQQQLTCTCKP